MMINHSPRMNSYTWLSTTKKKVAHLKDSVLYIHQIIHFYIFVRSGSNSIHLKDSVLYIHQIIHFYIFVRSGSNSIQY